MRGIKYVWIFLITVLLSESLSAQVQDSAAQNGWYKKTIFPTALIITGTALNHSAIEKNFNVYLRTQFGSEFDFQIENYLQYVPIAEMYGADLLGVKAKNHWFDQTKYLFISDMLSTGITSLIKIALNKTRPNGGDLSFPSGHSCFSFTNATVLYNEYKESAPMLAYSGFAFSTATASLRMVHNKHWLSDVLVGSGIGILVANFVYVVEPFKNFNPFKNNENISLLPQIVENSYGLYFSYKF